MRGLKSDKAVFDEQISQLEKRLAVYDSILSGQKYIAGNVSRSILQLMLAAHTKKISQDLTLVDIFHLPYASMLARAGSDVMNAFPNVSR